MNRVRRLGWGVALLTLLCGLALAAPCYGLAKSGRSGFEAGTYKGTTSQGLPITLTVSQTAVPSVEFGWRAKCADGRRHTNTISGRGGAIHQGSFSWGGVLNTGGHFHIRGSLRGTKASGSLSRWGNSAFNTGCLAKGVKWRAHLVSSATSPGSKPITYTGTTSQGLSIHIVATPTAILSLDFGWTASCADGQTHTNTISAGGGPITNGHFSLGGVLDTGGHFQVDGTVNGTSASGTLSRSGPSAFGTFDCSVSGVSWQAQASTSMDYTGTTSQGLPIHIVATPTTILSLDFGWAASCADGQWHTNTISAGGGPITNGSFSLGGTLNTGGHFQVDGTVNGTSASGTLSRSGPSAFGTFDCSASGVSWQAQALAQLN